MLLRRSGSVWMLPDLRPWFPPVCELQCVYSLKGNQDGYALPLTQIRENQEMGSQMGHLDRLTTELLEDGY